MNLPGGGVSMARVVITHWVHPEVIDMLRGSFEVVANPTRETLPRRELLRRVQDAQAMMVFMPDNIDEGFLRDCPDLRIVAGAFKGYDNIDVGACARRGVWVTVVPDLLTVPTAEIAVGLVIGLARNIAEGDRLVRRGVFAGWRPVLYGKGCAGRTAGIVGMGAVGRAIAARLSALDMRLLYCDPVPVRPAMERRLRMARVDLDRLLESSDFVVLAVPLTPQTLHLIDEQRLARMKPGACLVNVGRGSVVDEEAAVLAMHSGRLSGYGADVFEMEDLSRRQRPERISEGLLSDPARTFLTPHLGSAVDEVRLKIELEAAANIFEALAGRVPKGAINRPAVLSSRKIRPFS
jgi:phosphonate dehydrogenase